MSDTIINLATAFFAANGVIFTIIFMAMLCREEFGK